MTCVFVDSRVSHGYPALAALPNSAMKIVVGDLSPASVGVVSMINIICKFNVVYN